MNGNNSNIAPAVQETAPMSELKHQRQTEVKRPGSSTFRHCFCCSPTFLETLTNLSSELIDVLLTVKHNRSRIPFIAHHKLKLIADADLKQLQLVFPESESDYAMRLQHACIELVTGKRFAVLNPVKPDASNTSSAGSAGAGTGMEAVVTSVEVAGGVDHQDDDAAGARNVGRSEAPFGSKSIASVTMPSSLIALRT